MIFHVVDDFIYIKLSVLKYATNLNLGLNQMSYFLFGRFGWNCFVALVLVLLRGFSELDSVSIKTKLYIYKINKQI